MVLSRKMSIRGVVSDVRGWFSDGLSLAEARGSMP